jgi:hypothetical protein
MAFSTIAIKSLENIRGKNMKPRSVYNEIFDDKLIVKRVKNKLPKLFQLAELESSRDGKIGMEIGSVRERIMQCLCSNMALIL